MRCPPTIIGYSLPNADLACARAFSCFFLLAGREKFVYGSFLNFRGGIAFSFCEIIAGNRRYETQRFVLGVLSGESFMMARMTASCNCGRNRLILLLLRVG